MMALMANVDGRANFNLSYSEIMNLPISLRDAMIDTMQCWRSQEDAK